MRRRLTRRRALMLGMTSAAGVAAAALAAVPMLGGAGVPANTAPQGFLNQAELGTFDHNLAHRASPPAARRAAASAIDLCGDPAFRAADPAACPVDGAGAGELSAARAAAADGEVTALAAEQDGAWETARPIPTTAIHGVVMPTGKVLYFSQPKFPTEQETDGGNAHVWDPATGQTRSVPPPVVTYTGRDAGAITAPANLWCAGQTLLPDGRVLVVGGNLEYPTASGLGNRAGFKGGRWVMTFDPWTETWTRYQDMPHGRWYPTLTTLPDGRVLIVGGWDETGGSAPNATTAPAMSNNQDVEVFDPALATGAGADPTAVVSKLPPNGPGQTQPYPDHQYLGLYPHMFVLPDTTEAGAGDDPKVLVAGPLQWDSAIIDTGDWTWRDVLDEPYDPGDVPLSSDRAWGTAYLEPSGPDGSSRVVLLGGSNSAAAAPGAGSTPPPLDTAEVLDLNDVEDGWKIDPDLELKTGRAHFNTVLLPDGSVFTNGGGYGRDQGSMYAGPVYSSELLAPGGAGGWRTVGQEDDARTYHSTSLLLPSGKVISAGDDRDIAPSHIPVSGRTYQLYDPPYLFKGERPRVTFAPQRLRYDAPFRLAVQGDPAAITGAWLMRPGATTHAVDMNQQAIRLDLTAQADGLTLATPLNATVAPPGYYMLFVQNAAGAVSTASWIRLDPTAPDAPPLPVAPAPAAAPAPAPAPAPTAPAAPARARTPAPPAPRLVVTTRRGATRLGVSARLPASLAGRRVAIERRIGRATVLLGSVRVAGNGRLLRTIPLRPGATASRGARTGIRGATAITVRLRVLPAPAATGAAGRYATARISLRTARSGRG